MDAEVAKKLSEWSKKTQEDFNTEILPILERIFKLPSEEQKDFVKKAFSDEFLEELKKLSLCEFSLIGLKTEAALSNLDPQLVDGFFKNNPQVQDNRGKILSFSESKILYPQIEGGKITKLTTEIKLDPKVKDGKILTLTKTKTTTK